MCAAPPPATTTASTPIAAALAPIAAVLAPIPAVNTVPTPAPKLRFRQTRPRQRHHRSRRWHHPRRGRSVRTPPPARSGAASTPASSADRKRLELRRSIPIPPVASAAASPDALKIQLPNLNAPCPNRATTAASSAPPANAILSSPIAPMFLSSPVSSVGP